MKAFSQLFNIPQIINVKSYLGINRYEISIYFKFLSYVVLWGTNDNSGIIITTLTFKVLPAELGKKLQMYHSLTSGLSDRLGKTPRMHYISVHDPHFFCKNEIWYKYKYFTICWDVSKTLFKSMINHQKYHRSEMQGCLADTYFKGKRLYFV